MLLSLCFPSHPMVSASGTSHPSRHSPSLSHPLKLCASISAAASNFDLHEHIPARTSEVGASGTVELLETEIDFATMVEAVIETLVNLVLLLATHNKLRLDHGLDAKNLATILRHCEVKVFFVDYECVEKAGKAVELLMATHCEVVRRD
nr:butyrate--CoA ligase AAE11, peroxisomal-like [Ipomoea batatas]